MTRRRAHCTNDNGSQAFIFSPLEIVNGGDVIHLSIVIASCFACTYDKEKEHMTSNIFHLGVWIFKGVSNGNYTAENNICFISNLINDLMRLLSSSKYMILQIFS